MYSFWRNSSDAADNDERMRDDLARIAYLRSMQEVETRFRNARLILQNTDSPLPLQVVASYDLAHFYRYGYGQMVKENFGRSLSFYEFAAREHHAGACYELARLFLHGYSSYGIVKNPERARQYILSGLEGEGNANFNTPSYKQDEYIALLKGLQAVVDSFYTPPGAGPGMGLGEPRTISH